MLEFACPACAHKLRIKEELAGKKGKCPRCAATMVVPVPAGPTETEAAPPHRAAADEAAGPLATEAPRDTHSDAATGGADGRPPSPLTDFLAPPLGPDEVGRLGRYRVLKVLGAGGMGVVFQAEDPGLQRFVALKAMLPGLAASATARERFLREARSAAAVEHDHIVHVYEVGEDRGVPYLAMLLLRGEPLDVRLKRDRRLPVAEALRVAREAASGLEAARQRGMIHRDIKPANLWLEEGTRRVKILDFGLARASDDAGLTQQGAILGTPAYMAPEQAGGNADHRSDLFSLGCVLYRMATGEPAFKGADAISTLLAVATRPARPPLELNPNLPPALSDLILRLLAKKPEDRPASAQAVVEAIRAIEAEPKPRPRPRTRVGQSGPQRPVVAGAPARSGSQRLAPAAAGLNRVRPAAPADDATVQDRAASPTRRAAGAWPWIGLVTLLLAGAAVGGWSALPYLRLGAFSANPESGPPVTDPNPVNNAKQPAKVKDSSGTPRDTPRGGTVGKGHVVERDDHP